MKKFLVFPAVFLTLLLIISGCSSTPSTSTTSPITTQPTTTTVSPTSSQPATTTTTAKPTTSTATSSTPPASPTPTTTPSTKYGGTIRWVQPVGPGTAIGWIAEAAGESLRTMQLSIETLMSGQSDGSLAPGLATSVDINTDPSNASATFHLRKGVKFQDGSDFNAQVVKWNLEQTKAGTANASTTMYWKSFDILDDYTLRLNFTTYQNRIAMGLGMPATNMVSQAAFTKNGVDWMRLNMVGTGAFSQSSYQRDVVTKTVRNPNYWDTGKPYLNEVDYLYVADEMTRVALFRSGGAEVLDLNYNGRIANELKASGYTISSLLGGCNMLMGDSMNVDSPWANVKVRQAAEYALDKASLTNTFGFGYWQTAYQMPSPGSTIYDPNFSGSRTYDVAKAKQLLTEAGYPDGFKTKIIAVNTVNRDIIVAIQAYLAKVGIQATLEFPEIAQFQGYQQGTWNNALLYATIFEYPNFNYNLNLYFSTTSAWYKSLKKPEGWKAALDASLITPQPDKPTIQKLVRMLYDDATVITLNYPSFLSAMTNNVRDTGIYSRITNYYWRPPDAWLAK
jgi:peptide/nickel transport system substrate-binding protein